MPDPSASGFLHARLLEATIVLVAAGALLFGAVYPWVFIPGGIALTLVGLLATLSAGRMRPPVAMMALGFGAIAVAIILQLVPLPSSTLARVSPGTDWFLRQTDLTYVAAGMTDSRAETTAAAEPSRPISIAPGNTLVGLGLFTALAVFAIGSACRFSVTSGGPVAVAILWICIGLAAFGIAQDVAIGRDVGMRVYGFWKTQVGASPFGPFINRNHFAGWMLMALPLGLGLLVDQIQRAASVLSGAQRRDIFFVASSPLGGRAMMTAVGCVLMGLSLALTRSRSGVAAFIVGAVVLMWFLVRREGSTRGRLAVTAVMLAVMGVALLGAGLNTSLGRFAAVDTEAGNESVQTIGGRNATWRDALRMVRISPVTGHGLNSYGTGMFVYQTGSRQLHFQEAHNDYLQLAAEGGLLLGLPVLLTVALLARQTYRRFRESPRTGTTYWIRVGAIVGMVSIAAQSFFEFSLQMPGNAALFALLVGIALHQSPNLRRR